MNHKALLIQARDALDKAGNLDPVSKGYRKVDPVIAALQVAIDAPEPEPAYFMQTDGYCLGSRLDAGHAKETLLPIYTRPVPINPLTDEQIEEIMHSVYAAGNHGRSLEIAFARAIEAALRGSEWIDMGTSHRTPNAA